MREYGVESDGELFKMQQEAIKRARETAMQSQYREAKQPLVENEQQKNKKKGILFGESNPFSSILKNFKTDDLLLLVILFFLINEEQDEDIILIILFLLFVK